MCHACGLRDIAQYSVSQEDRAGDRRQEERVGIPRNLVRMLGVWTTRKQLLVRRKQNKIKNDDKRWSLENRKDIRRKMRKEQGASKRSVHRKDRSSAAQETAER